MMCLGQKPRRHESVGKGIFWMEEQERIIWVWFGQRKWSSHSGGGGKHKKVSQGANQGSGHGDHGRPATCFTKCSWEPVGESQVAWVGGHVIRYDLCFQKDYSGYDNGF